jgi:hypothetical protein
MWCKSLILGCKYSRTTNILTILEHQHFIYLCFSPPKRITNPSNNLANMQPHLRMLMLQFKLAIDLQTLVGIHITLQQRIQQRKAQRREKVCGNFSLIDQSETTEISRIGVRKQK